MTIGSFLMGEMWLTLAITKFCCQGFIAFWTETITITSPFYAIYTDHFPTLIQCISQFGLFLIITHFRKELFLLSQIL